MKYTSGLLLGVLGLLGPGRAADAATQGRPSHVPWPFEHVGAVRESSYPFLSRGERYGVAVSAAEFRMVLDNGPKGRTPTTVVRLNLQGADPRARLVPGERLRSTSSYFVGGKQDERLRKVPHYATLKAAAVYPGVDLVLSRGGHALEYELVVAPGARPSAIRLGFRGMQKLRMDKNGDVTLRLDGGDLVHRAPDCYQWVGQKKVAIAARYRQLGDRMLGLEIERWDRSLALFIRPVVDYIAFIGAGGNEAGKAIDVDAQGSAYVAGTTLAFGTVLPTTPGAVQPGPAGGTTDVFVVKLTPDGASIAYATFLGGTSTDSGYGIAVDGNGSAYVTGETYSTDFPFTPGAFRTANAGRFDAFVTKLNADGTALVYSSYLGGNGNGLGDDAGRGIAVNSGGEAYVTGATGSGDFPMAGQPAQSVKRSFGDAFVTKFRADGSGLVYSTFLGGDGADVGYAIALDRAGNAYVAGETSGAFPTTPQAFQPVAPGGSMEGFVTKVSANGSTLVYSTYVGGPSVDRAFALDVTDGGRAYVAGVAPAGFPTTPGALQTTNAGSNDAFVAALAESGSTLVFATYLGGSQVDRANGIGVDRAGNAYVTGETYSSDFPTAHGALSRCQGGGFTTGCSDAFVVKLDNSGSRLLYSSFLGGPMSDYGSDIVATPGGDAYLTGYTSSDIPTTPSGYRLEQSPFGLFVAKLSNRASSACDVALSQPSYANGQSVTVASAKVTNDRLEDFAFEVKIYHRAPDGSIVSVLNRGGDGTFLVTAQSEEQLAPLAVLTVGAATPRGQHAIGCRIREPGTGELLAEATQTFEVP